MGNLLRFILSIWVLTVVLPWAYGVIKVDADSESRGMFTTYQYLYFTISKLLFFSLPVQDPILDYINQNRLHLFRIVAWVIASTSIIGVVLFKKRTGFFNFVKNLASFLFGLTCIIMALIHGGMIWSSMTHDIDPKFKVKDTLVYMDSRFPGYFAQAIKWFTIAAVGLLAKAK